MTEFKLQTLYLADSEIEIQKQYFEWGRGYEEDANVPEWDKAPEEQRLITLLRGYALYDGLNLPNDNVLSPVEVYASMGINSRVTSLDAVRFMRCVDEANPLLAKIPSNVVLVDCSTEVIEVTAQLINLFTRERHIGLGKATKVLHKKRSALIPILDAYAVDFLYKNFPFRLIGAYQTREILLLLQELLNLKMREIQSIQSNLLTYGINLTKIRIMDYLIWIGWRPRMDKNGFGPPIKKVWDTSNYIEARTKSRKFWEEQNQFLYG